MGTLASRFIGRNDDRELLQKLLADATLVTITGPGGVGKTRLAREVAASTADRVVWCELSGMRADADASTIAGLLGYASVDAAAAALADPPSILVLDNCEHVLGATHDLVMQLTGAARILATSREPFAIDGEQILVLGPLSSDAAVELFIDRANSAGARWDRSDETLDAISALCDRLDGLPLAIELAAARARVLSPVEMLAHMHERLDLLRRPVGVSSPRHESVRCAFDVSAALLDPEERAVFTRLSIFAGPFDVDLAHAVASLPGTDRVHTIDVLARLVDRSLVVAEPDGARTRYRLLDLLRDYAAELLDAGELELVRDRFIEAITAFADHIIAEGTREWSGEVITRITAQLPNLSAAIEWSVDRDPDPGRAFRMILPLFAIIHQSRAPEALFLGGQILLRWPDTPAPLRAEALGVLAIAAILTGNEDRATTLAQASLEDENGTGIAQVLAHRALGFTTRARHDESAAREHFGTARRAAEALGAAPFARELAGLEASALDALGDTAAALTLLDDTIGDAVAAGDHLNEAWVRLLRTTVMTRHGDWTAARADLDAARAAVSALTVPWYEGATLRTDAILVAQEHGWDASVPCWREAVEQGVALGAAGEVALTLRAAAVVAARAGRGAVAQALRDATPPVHELTVLPDVFQEASPTPATSHPATAPPDLRTALTRARAALGDASPDVPAGVNQLQREGDAWTLTYANRTARVRDMKGISDIATLVARPGAELHCLELIGGVALEGDVGATLDDRARREYQARIVELQREVEEARAHNDLARADRAEQELDALVAQLADAFGLGGRDRPKGSAAERARTAVANRVRAAVKRIGEVHPELGLHFANTIRTGTWCSYRSERATPWDVNA